ncbi:hypothetical protein SELMODRAFT_424716 [Selaginella moellendorffii]|uniref:Uncharacterized protein n=1 Tax=Selaginella moellendorffii TaxID=88036 RepID=D8SQU3_SELML|nr:hypothetical protein SELMODRAFT_424716 [Selaginella moellendorffii]
MVFQLLLLACLLFQCQAILGSPTKKAYIAYLGTSKGVESSELTLIHHDILARAVGSIENARSSIIFSYKYAFSGFSAYLTEQEAETISRMPEVLNIYPSKTLHPLTTHSWDFLGMAMPAKSSHAGSPSAPTDVIVGLLDTGIWPESESFKDTDMGPVPARWKGTCVNPPGTKANETVNCNKKLVGARYYNGAKVSTGPYKNSRDSVGHGTHTSSTAAGSLVPHASKRGLAPGTARGGAPNARIAMYKVCWTDSCEEVDIAAGFDDAINDGVDVLSISLGGYPAVYSVDVIAIGAYHAVERGIMVSCAGGNSGPFTGSVSNGAPWIFTVGASTIDRDINEDAKIAANRKSRILRGTTIPYKPAPVVAEFSSRGPHTISPDIIKPDVTAPGVEILAAWPSNIPDTDNGKEVFVEYTFLSGTSMACPHVSGTIAYLKSIHPTWSPAAIKSAVMTTAITKDNTNKTIVDPSTNKAATVFDVGNGEIQPAKAVDPGLVYDTDPLDYITYLCNSGYTSKQIQNITGDSSSKCPRNDTSFSLNYPSIAVLLDGSSKTVERTVTNVGNPRATYTASVGSAKGISISVTPSKLSFTSAGQKLSYSVTVSAKGSIAADPQARKWSFSDLTWEDGVHVVRSPIAVRM